MTPVPTTAAAEPRSLNIAVGGRTLRSGRSLVGYGLWLPSLAALILSIPAASHAGLATWVSLACSSAAFAAMTVNVFLAARPRLMEPSLGGLDRMFRHHRLAGMAILVLLLVHYFVTPTFRGLALNPAQDGFAAWCGKIGFYGILALVVLSVVKRLPLLHVEFPYHWWRQLHRLMGLLFILVAMHQFLIKRPFDGTATLAIYLNVLAVLGVAFFIWSQVAPLVRRRTYVVASVEPGKVATTVYLKPVGSCIRARPGQFCFVKVARKGLRESHPFSVAGLWPDGTLRFVVKPAGDFTSCLGRTLAVGDRARVEGGYGRFVYTGGGAPQIWLAGGIGITPFMGLAEAHARSEGPPIHLIHVVRRLEDAVGRDLFESCESAGSRFHYTVHASQPAGRFDADRLITATSLDPGRSEVWFCGPASLRKAILKGFRARGVEPVVFRFEQFEFR